MASPARNRVSLRTRPRCLPRNKGKSVPSLSPVPDHPQLVRGHAEIFGAELAEGKSYLFGSECKAAVFTWHGCTIQMSLSSSCSAPPHPPCTSPAVPPQSMSPMRPQCPLMQTSTSPSNRCVSAPSVTFTDPLLPTTINMQLQNPPESSFWARKTLERHPFQKF